MISYLLTQERTDRSHKRSDEHRLEYFARVTTRDPFLADQTVLEPHPTRRQRAHCLARLRSRSTFSSNLEA